MDKKEAKYYCVVEYSTGSEEGKMEVITKSNIETLDGIESVKNYVKEDTGAENAMIIHSIKLKR